MRRVSIHVFHVRAPNGESWTVGDTVRAEVERCRDQWLAVEGYSCGPIETFLLTPAPTEGK